MSSSLSNASRRFVFVQILSWKAENVNLVRKNSPLLYINGKKWTQGQRERESEESYLPKRFTMTRPWLDNKPRYRRFRSKSILASRNVAFMTTLYLS